MFQKTVVHMNIAENMRLIMQIWTFKDSPFTSYSAKNIMKNLKKSTTKVRVEG